MLLPQDRNFLLIGIEHDGLSAVDKTKAEPAKDVIMNGLGIAKFWLLRPTARLEARMRELVAEQLEGNTVLQRQRNADCKAVHHSGERRAFLCHDDEDFTWLVVGIKPNRDVALVTGDCEGVSDGRALVGQVVTHCWWGRLGVHLAYATRHRVSF